MNKNIKQAFWLGQTRLESVFYPESGFTPIAIFFSSFTKSQSLFPCKGVLNYIKKYGIKIKLKHNHSSLVTLCHKMVISNHFHKRELQPGTMLIFDMIEYLQGRNTP